MSKDVFRDPEYDSTSHERRLPPLHDVLGDVLDYPSRPSLSRRGFPENGRGAGSHPMRSDRGPSLAPLSHHSTHASGQYSSHRSQSNLRRSPPYPTSPTSPLHVGSSQPPSYHLFNFSPNQGLVHQGTSAHDDLDPNRPRPRAPPSDPSRRYCCPECGNRFAKQSTLKNHLLTHSGERPFSCPHPGCGRRFSMACNMQRHARTHTGASAFLLEDDGDIFFPSESSTQPSSRGGSSRGGSPRTDSSKTSSPRAKSHP